MATTRFNGNIVTVARMLKDPRTSAGPDADTGRRFTSALLAGYQNRAIRDFLKEKMEQLGDDFPRFFPEYVRRSGNLTLVAGAVAKPSDAYVVLELATADLLTYFDRLSQGDVLAITSGSDGIIQPSTARPAFWEEYQQIRTLGVTAGNVIARYIRTHQDITVVTTGGNGNWNTAAGSWTQASRRLAATMATTVAANSPEQNKPVMFRTATNVYTGRIQSVPAQDTFELYGDGLPSGDIAGPNVLQVMISDSEPDDNDLKLDPIWYPEIQRRMYDLALTDVRNGVLA